jgi:signal peptidase I
MLFGYGSVVVGSGSMEPSIRVGDVVLTAATDGEDLGVGTVINHRMPDSMRLHRITEIVADRYRTGGDANRSHDSELVAPDQVLGVGIALVPFVGLPRVWIDQRDWLRLGVVLGVLVLASHASRRAFLQPARVAWTGT